MMLSFARSAARSSLRAAAPARVASRALATPSGTMFTGVWPIMATPFRPDESLDLEGFAKAVAFMAEAGADGCTIAGVLGESNRLTDAERAAMWRELGDYAESLQTATDADGKRKVDFPENFDEVVGLMNRRDLETPEGSDGWAVTALNGGGYEKC